MDLRGLSGRSDSLPSRTHDPPASFSGRRGSKTKTVGVAHQSIGRRPEEQQLFSDLQIVFAMSVKVVLRLVPTAVNAAIATTAIRAAINAYSIAVTRIRSFSNWQKARAI